MCSCNVKCLCAQTIFYKFNQNKFFKESKHIEVKFKIEVYNYKKIQKRKNKEEHKFYKNLKIKKNVLLIRVNYFTFR